MIQAFVTRRCFAVIFMASAALSFTQPASTLNGISGTGRCRHCRFEFHSASESNDSYTGDEKKDMEKLIVSLSLEPTDESRRTRLQTVFTEELAKPNGAPKKFTDLFSSTLTIVGDRIQLRAAETLNKQLSEEEQGLDKDEDEPRQEIEKTKEGKQLWALIDMMVQSKTIVQRSTGELGSKGTFQ